MSTPLDRLHASTTLRWDPLAESSCMAPIFFKPGLFGEANTTPLWNQVHHRICNSKRAPYRGYPLPHFSLLPDPFLCIAPFLSCIKHHTSCTTPWGS